MKKLFRTFVILGTLILVIGSVGSARAQIDTDVDTAEVEILTNGAGLVVSVGATDFQDVIYSFTDQTTTGTLIVGLTDLRSTAVGWTVNLKASDFVRTGGGAPITVNNLSLVNGTIATQAGKPATASPLQSIVTPFGPTTAFQNIWTAPATSGDGTYTLTYASQLVIPGNTLAGVYTSTITVEVPVAP